MQPVLAEPVHPSVVDRLGAEVVRNRLRTEARLWSRKTRPREGIFRLGRFLPMNAIIRACLRAGGLHHRARREFLDVRIVENRVAIPNLPRAFDGYRLLQLADLHCDLDPALPGVIVDRLRSVRFDRAVLTGDYHNEIGSPYGESMRLMLRLIEHLGDEPLGVMGNHDFLGMIPPLEEAGLSMLLNENRRVARNGDSIWICGIDDPHLFKTHDLARARREVPAHGCAILLSHSPETYREAAAHGYALHLSGHTHGGQLCLPGGHAIVRKAAVPRALIAGRWSHGPMQGYTSRGTGSCNVAARLNCPPEITLHVLRRA